MGVSGGMWLLVLFSNVGGRGIKASLVGTRDISKDLHDTWITGMHVFQNKAWPHMPQQNYATASFFETPQTMNLSHIQIL